MESTKVFVTPTRPTTNTKMPVSINLKSVGLPGINDLVSMVQNLSIKMDTLMNLERGQRKILENQDIIKRRLDAMENEVVNLKDEISVVAKGKEENAGLIRETRDEVSRFSDELEALRFEQVRQEQYSRKASFRVFGVEEEEDENIEEKCIQVINDEIGVEIEKSDIDIVHRAGRRRSDGKPRAILVKCVSHKTKLKVMREKKKAKHVTIKEDLAYGMQDYMYQVIEKKSELGIESVWTIDGKIRCKFEGGERFFTVNSFDDFYSLMSGDIHEY